MIDAEQLQHRGVEISYVDGMVDGIISEFIGAPVAEASFNGSSWEKHRITFNVVISPAPLGHRCAAKFSTEHN